MARYIDADAFKQKLADKDIFFPALYANELNEMPTADVVEVVRCKDCEHRHTFGCPMYHEEYIDWDDDGYWETDLIIHDATNDNDFCNYGERNINECKEK